jgi:hypothetical protein
LAGLFFAIPFECSPGSLIIPCEEAREGMPIFCCFARFLNR